MTAAVTVAGLAALIAAFTTGALLRGRGAASSTVSAPTHVSIEVPADLDIRPLDEQRNLQISRDGRILYLIAGRGSDRQIYARALDERSVRPVPGTEGLDDTSLMVSPDGEWGRRWLRLLPDWDGGSSARLQGRR